MTSIRRVFWQLASVISLLLASSFSWANGKAVYQCACLLSPTCANSFESTESLLEHALKTNSPSIVRLAQTLSESLSDPTIANHRKESFAWEQAQQLLNLHDLIGLQKEGIPESEIADVADGYAKQINEIVSQFADVPAAKQEDQQLPVFAGAEYLSLPEVASPQFHIFVAQGTELFSKWMKGLGPDKRKAIQKRLTTISSQGHFGDVEATQQNKNKSSATIFEMRFHQGGGARIYYLQTGASVVILTFGLKSEGKKAQDRAVQRAGELALALLN